jgi:putative Ca2+/H+ antiporter (TMEM165/GDT1 family)
VLSAFIAGLSFITVSELGDGSFFIAMFLAMKHSRRLIFCGVLLALIVMTIISVAVGQVAYFLPKGFVHHVSIFLFFGFGLKMFYDAYRMSGNSEDEVIEEAKAVVIKAEEELSKQASNWQILVKGFVLTFLAEWGDRTQIATISLAVNNEPIGLTLGSILGHAICTAIAVGCGKIVCGRISERKLTVIGGCLFILFGVLATFEKA